MGPEDSLLDAILTAVLMIALIIGFALCVGHLPAGEG